MRSVQAESPPKAMASNFSVFSCWSKSKPSTLHSTWYLSGDVERIAVGTGTASDSMSAAILFVTVYVDVEVEVANFCDAFLRPLAAARAKRIGGDIDVRAVVVLIAQPSEIAGRDGLLQPSRCAAS